MYKLHMLMGISKEKSVNRITEKASSLNTRNINLRPEKSLDFVELNSYSGAILVEFLALFFLVETHSPFNFFKASV